MLQYLILSTIAATAGDLTFDDGQWSLTGLGEAVVHRDTVEWRKDTYSAGVASDKSYNLGTGFTLAANTEYKLSVHNAKAADGLVKKRWYRMFSGDTAPTAAALVDFFVAAINADPNSRVTATDATASIQLVLDDVAQGDFNTKFYQDTVEVIPTPTVNTAFTAVQGTPELVAAATGATDVSSTGQFTRYEVDHYIWTSHDMVKGNRTGRKVTTVIFLDETDSTDYAALVVAMDKIPNGTHGTQAAYNSVPLN